MIWQRSVTVFQQVWLVLMFGTEVVRRKLKSILQRLSTFLLKYLYKDFYFWN